MDEDKPYADQCTALQTLVLATGAIRQSEATYVRIAKGRAYHKTWLTLDREQITD